MREEGVTISIIKWLEELGWEIICYDFPQSGTGIVLHPNNRDDKAKNKGSIIPDIIAVKENVAILFENKDKFVLSDFEKILSLRINNLYSDSLNALLIHKNISNIYYGIGIPMKKHNLEKSMLYTEKIDFLISVKDDGKILINFIADNIKLKFY